MGVFGCWLGGFEFGMDVVCVGCVGGWFGVVGCGVVGVVVGWGMGDGCC